jgi:hypothetical protein
MYTHRDIQRRLDTVIKSIQRQERVILQRDGALESSLELEAM